MDQIGKLYQNRAMVLQEEVNRLEKLLEAIVKNQDPRPETAEEETYSNDSRAKRENSRSGGRTRPPSTTVRDEPGFLPKPLDILPLPFQSEPAESNAFAKMAQSDSSIASKIENIPTLPGDTFDALYNKYPWQTALGLGAGGLYTGIPRSAVNPVANLAKWFAFKFGMPVSRPLPFEAAIKGKDGFNVVKPDPITTKPKAAKPSSLAGKFDFPEFSDLFEPNPTRTTRGVLKAVGDDIVAALKPGGMYSALEIWKARTRNDEIIKRWTEVTKPTGESHLRAANVGRANVDLANAQTQLNTSTGELNALKTAPPSSGPGGGPTQTEIDNLIAKEAEVAGDTAVQNAQAKNLQRLKTIAGDAKTAAAESSAAYRAATQTGVPLSNFDYKAWAMDRLNPKTMSGIRNLATGGLSVLGDLAVGQAVRSGLDEVPYLDDKERVKDVVSATAGGGAAGLLAATLTGAAATPLVLPGALIAGTGALYYGVGEDLARKTGLEDQITGMAAIRKTPGITRGELEAKRPSTDPDLDDKTKAEYARAAADYLSKQARKKEQATVVRDQTSEKYSRQNY
jgi:hypothetical protein